MVSSNTGVAMDAFGGPFAWANRNPSDFHHGDKSDWLSWVLTKWTPPTALGGGRVVGTVKGRHLVWSFWRTPPHLRHAESLSRGSGESDPGR